MLYQKHLGTAATLIKGGTQEAKFQRLLSLELPALRKGWKGGSANGRAASGPGASRRRTARAFSRWSDGGSDEAPQSAPGGRGSTSTGLRNERQKLQPLRRLAFRWARLWGVGRQVRGGPTAPRRRQRGGGVTTAGQQRE